MTKNLLAVWLTAWLIFMLEGESLKFHIELNSELIELVRFH